MSREKDRYSIDGHKLHYHIDRINQWKNHDKSKVYPIYVEISPAGACNHRCTFCAVDYIGYKTRYLDTENLKKNLTDMGKRGIRSVMYAGEGEPLLHKDLAEIINHTKEKAGIDVSITSNGTLLNETFVRAALKNITWIKISFNAGSPETYEKVHQTKGSHFDLVLRNLKRAVQIKNENNWGTTLGLQILLLPENAKEIRPLAELVKSIGLDYLVIKPYSQHKKSITQKYSEITYEPFMGLKESLLDLNDENFEAVFRINTMKKWDDRSQESYQKCYSTPYFWAYIMASGDVYGCSAYLEDDRFCYGNINNDTFSDIWEGEKRKASMDFVANQLNISECRKNCRMDEVNRYLWNIEHPPQHANFI